MNTLFDKIWDAHVVQKVEDGPTQLYIDRLYCHEVTSPQAFCRIACQGIGSVSVRKRYSACPTIIRRRTTRINLSKTLCQNAGGYACQECGRFRTEHFGMMDKKNGIIHVVGPERG